jgi:acetyltransferase-like isoleucine patch superfamily enzyme
VRRALNFVLSLIDPRSWMQLLRLVHYYGYTHARERGKVRMGRGVRFAPNVSIKNGERVQIGDRSHIGARCHLWAGDTEGRVIIDDDCLFGPEVFITVANYGRDPGRPVMTQPRVERDVVIGRDVWLGARVMVLPGVSIGDGCIVGAGSVVSRSLPPLAIAVGNPARVIGWRGAEHQVEGDMPDVVPRQSS